MSIVTTEAGDTGSAEVTATTMCEAFQATAAADPDAIAISASDGSRELTWGQYAAAVRQIATQLDALGVRRGDTVAILMGNRPEFHLVDTAAYHLGATPFSIYNTSSAEQIEHVLENSGAKVIVAEQQYLGRILAARGERSEPSSLVLIDGEAEGCLSLSELEARGEQNTDFDFDAAWQAVEPEDVLTMIYTSGTTGPSKGVELTHANMLAECRAMAAVLPIRRDIVFTSYLPHAHAADRWASHYNSAVYGVSITTVYDPSTIGQVLGQLHPKAWGAVPRVLEKLTAALKAGIDADPDEARRAAVLAAIDLGITRVQLQQAGEPVPEELEAKFAVMNEKVLSGLRAKIGLDRCEWLIVGAAQLPRGVQEFLMGIGLPVTELYGMSEASCCTTTCLPDEAKIGCVGRVLPTLEAKLADDGELMFRGPVVMKGYRGQPEKTAEALDADGWLHTGDIAEIDDEGFVKIVDRKKELIINAGGKNMSPQAIESALKQGSSLIGQAAAIGDSRPYNVALLVLDPDAARAFAAQHGISADDLSAVAADPAVQAEVSAGVERANERLARVEQIKRFRLLGEEWLPGGDELTPTMKLKRKPIAAKYAEIIEALYV